MLLESFNIISSSLNDEQKLGGNTGSEGLSNEITSNGSITISISMRSSGCFTITKNMIFSNINIYFTSDLTSNNVIIINGEHSLTINNVISGGESKAVQISDSLIKVSGGACISLTSVSIQNIKLIGEGKYGVVMTVDFLLILLLIVIQVNIILFQEVFLI